MFEAILITGGAGFVGSSLAIRLRREMPDTKVWAMDNLRRRGSELNLSRLAEAGAAFVHGDIRSPTDLEAAPRADVVIDCSAEPSAQAGYDGSPGYLIETNMTGCFHLLEWARRHKALFLFLSTSRVYPFPLLNRLVAREDETRFTLADSQEIPGASAQGISEEFPLTGARSLYGMTKLASELMIEEYREAFGLRAAITRFGLLAGPWQMAKSDQGVIALWTAAHHFRRRLAYIGFGGTGKQVRDCLHIDDFCDLIVDQLRNFDRYEGRVLNAGGGLANSLSLRECTALCQEVTGNRIEMGSVAENRPADVRSYITDHRAITEAGGWRPQRDTRRIIADIATWIAAEEPRLKGLLA